MSNKSLIDGLIKLCKRFDKKYYVNEGGCIYLSYLISKYLKKLSIDYEIIEWFDNDNDPFHISILINGIDINPAKNEYNGHQDNLGKKEPKWIMSYNKENEDKLSYFWKQKYKLSIKIELSEFFEKYIKD